MSQLNTSAVDAPGKSTPPEKLSRLLNDVAFHAHLIALRATVHAVREGRLRPTRRLSSSAAIEPRTIKLVGEIDQAAAALDDAVQALRSAVERVEQLARHSHATNTD